MLNKIKVYENLSKALDEYIEIGGGVEKDNVDTLHYNFRELKDFSEILELASYVMARTNQDVDIDRSYDNRVTLSLNGGWLVFADILLEDELFYLNLSISEFSDCHDCKESRDAFLERMSVYPNISHYEQELKFVFDDVKEHMSDILNNIKLYREEYDKEFLLLRHAQLQAELEEVKLKLNQT